MPAFEAGEVDCDQVRVSRHVFCRPDLLAGVLAVVVFPDVGDVHRVSDEAGPYVLAEQPVENVLVLRQGVDAEDGVTPPLHVYHDLVVQAGVVVVRPAEHHDTDIPFLFQAVQHLSRFGPERDLVEFAPRIQGYLHRFSVLLFSEAEDVAERIVDLVLEERPVRHVIRRGEVAYPVLGEYVAFLGVRRFDHFRSDGDYRARKVVDRVDELGPHVLNDGEEYDVRFHFHVEDEVVNVGDRHFAREALVDGPAPRAFEPHLRIGVIGVHNVAGAHSQRLEIGGEEGGQGIHVKRPGHPDLDVRSPLDDLWSRSGRRGMLLQLQQRQQTFGLGCRLVVSVLQQRADFAYARGPESGVGRLFHEVGIGFADLVHPRLDGFDVLYLLDLAFLACRDDEPVGLAIRRFGVDERPQARVLAEAAPGGLVPRGGELEGLRGGDADETGVPLGSYSGGLERRPDRAALARELVHANRAVGHFRLDEIVLGLDRREVVLSASLQDEVGPELSEVRLGNHIKPDVFRQHLGKPCHDLLFLPSELLEVDDVRLHEDCAPITEDRDLFG